MTDIVSLGPLTLIHGVWRVDNEQREVSRAEAVRYCGGTRRRAHEKRDWVVGKTHPRLTSSVVVTFVQVRHTDTS